MSFKVVGKNILFLVPPRKLLRREKDNEDPPEEYDSIHNVYNWVKNNNFSKPLPLDVNNTSPTFIEKRGVLSNEKVSSKIAETIAHPQNMSRSMKLPLCIIENLQSCVARRELDEKDEEYFKSHETKTYTEVRSLIPSKKENDSECTRDEMPFQEKIIFSLDENHHNDSNKEMACSDEISLLSPGKILYVNMSGIKLALLKEVEMETQITPKIYGYVSESPGEMSTAGRTSDDFEFISVEDNDRDENFIVEHFSDDSEISDESDTEAIIPDEEHELLPPLSQTIKKRKIKRKKLIRCKFCNEDLLNSNFTRHIERKHGSESEVKQILILPKNSKERRQAFILLRNETNFGLFINGITRPCRVGDKNKKYYPCAYCKGLYLNLKRHAKFCIVKTMDKNKKNYVSTSHTMTACAMDTTDVISKLDVKRQVFDLMKGDDIAFEAKKDLLIVHFGESYLKKHKIERMAYACSSRMRELARLLIAYRRIINDNTISLKDMLRPNKFYLVLSAVKDIAGYDPINKTFKVPSLATHLGTSLKHVCNELLNLVSREDAGFKCPPNMSIKDWLEEVKNFMKLIESRWTIELANKDLQEKKLRTGEIDEGNGKESKKIFKKGWTDHELKCIEDEFDDYLERKTYPSGAEIKQFIEKMEMKRTILMVRSKLQHMKLRKGRKL